MGRVLVGRDAECAVLSRALAAAQGRRAPVVLVSGEGGAGKTTLVEHVLARTGTPVLSGRAAEWAGAAYDVLARALRPAVRDKARCRRYSPRFFPNGASHQPLRT